MAGLGARKWEARQAQAVPLESPKGPLARPQAPGQPLRDRTGQARPQRRRDTGPGPWAGVPPSLDALLLLALGVFWNRRSPAPGV